MRYSSWSIQYSLSARFDLPDSLWQDRRDMGAVEPRRTNQAR
jgi:hypothetical protein